MVIPSLIEAKKEIVALSVRVSELEELVQNPRLGLATTRHLLQEIKIRGETEPVYEEEAHMLAIGAANLLDRLPGSMLDYRPVDHARSETRY